MHNRRLQIAIHPRSSQPPGRAGSKPPERGKPGNGASWLHAFAAPPFIPAAVIKSVDIERKMKEPAKEKSYANDESSFAAQVREGISPDCGQEGPRAAGHDPAALVAALGFAYFTSHALAKLVSDELREKGSGALALAPLAAAPLVAAPLLLPEDAQAQPEMQAYASKPEEFPKPDMDYAPLAASAAAFIITSIILLAKEGSPKPGRGSRDKF